MPPAWCPRPSPRYRQASSRPRIAVLPPRVYLSPDRTRAEADMTHNPIRPWRNIDRRKSRRIMVGNVPVGGDAPITVQTMTNTITSDVRATLDQIIRAADVGADIVRVSTPDEASTRDRKSVV